ncbi:MAG TPA: DUF6531 domain-containing protein, partial [Chthonomonas sp.]|uniref:DUF6531 domain-containing protein n=1 Tax=Chthonomonas sp. TaxID=2282153 RepID=UPI002B4AC244
MSQRGIPRRQFLSSALAGLGAAFLAGASLESPQQAQALSTGSPPLPPTPGPARPWHPPVRLGIGHTNLASGNAHGAFPLFGWNGRGGGLAFTLFYNSQSSRTSPLGPKWSHSYRSYLLHVPNTQNVVWVQEDGS